MNNDAQREDVILDRLEIPTYPNVFWIGRRAVRLTFLSQQQRALNLIWALSATGRLKPKTEVTVVGAGLAGLTAAFAAHQLGAAVTLLESKMVPLHLQRGCQLRFVHPHILDWPQECADAPLTNLPCLNWGADMAAEVSNTVLQQWDEVEEVIKPKYGFELREIRKLPGDCSLVFAEGSGENYVAPCDVLILAVGFGLESSLPSVPFLSYWENDNFGRPLITEPIPRRYLVTGCGDGGLIDAIRLRLNAFDHAEFVYVLARMKGLKGFKDNLLKIDQRVARRIRKDKQLRQEIDGELAGMKQEGGGGFNEAAALKRLVADAEGRLFEEEYRRLKIPAALMTYLTSQLRRDTVVFLNSPNVSPLTMQASILNRFVVFFLRRYGGLRYRVGEAHVEAGRVGQPYRVTFRRHQFPTEELDVHEVVVRHGPISILDRLFPKQVAATCRSGPDDYDDPTRERMYPPTFLLEQPHLLDRKRAFEIEYALSRGPLAARERFDTSRYNRFGVEVTEDKVRYFLRLKDGDARPAASPSASLHGFDIVTETAAPRRGRAAQTPAAAPPKTPDIHLTLGDAICNIGPADVHPFEAAERSRTISTLGCFVAPRQGGRPGILLTVLTLGPPTQAQLRDRIARARVGGPNSPHVIATVSRLSLPMPSSPRANTAAGSVIYNSTGGGVARLLPGVQFFNRYDDRYTGLPRLGPPARDEARELIGARVFKVGAVSGVTWGTVSSVLVKTNLVGWDEQYYYQGLIMVACADAKPFALQGDSGALVVREDGAPLGLVLSGADKITLVSPLLPMLDAFNCDLLPFAQ